MDIEDQRKKGREILGEVIGKTYLERRAPTPQGSWRSGFEERRVAARRPCNAPARPLYPLARGDVAEWLKAAVC